MPSPFHWCPVNMIRVSQRVSTGQLMLVKNDQVISVFTLNQIFLFTGSFLVKIITKIPLLI